MSQNIVNLLGAGSGIDTLALVDQLVEAERSAPQERIDSKRETIETQISDLGLLSSALSTLQDAAATLGNADTFNSKSASFTDSTAFIPVSLNPEAQTGDYTFTIDQLAQAQSLSTDATFSDPSDAVGQGTLTFNFGSWNTVTPPADPTTFTADATKASQTITIDASNNSLTGLANAINDADFGVQASIINDGSSYRLVIRAESGLNNQLQITASDDDGNNTDSSGLSRFAFDAGAFQMTQNQIGQDAEFTVNGLSVTRTTNTIDDVIDGFEFTLSGATGVGETVNVSIEEDKTSAEQSVRDFVEAYNLFLETLEPLIGDNEETGEKGSLYGDTLAKNIPSQIRQLLVADVPGLDSDFLALTNVGIRTELDGTFSIDEDTFTDAIDDNYDLFKNLFIPVTDSSSDQITINSYGANTLSGEYAVVITQAPAKGNLVGVDSSDTLLADIAADSASDTNAVLTGAAITEPLSDFVSSSGNFTAGTATLPLNLATLGAGANDYDFSITVDGVASAANISLPVADYASYGDMATALQTAINNDTNISGVTVTYDTDHFVFTSSTTGAASNVSLTAVGINADDLGISTGSSTAGTGGANDYDFTIAVDGTTSGTISLTPGSYGSYDALATEIETQINADATLSGAGASVTVSYDGSSFVITSASTGDTSTLANATAIGSQAANLGITTGSLTQGDSSGDFNFVIAVNGTASASISLSGQSFADKDELAAYLETQINTDATLSAAGQAVEVSYDSGTDAFTVESTKYGTSSTVSFINVGTSAADIGLAAGTATAGINVAGTVDGVVAFGSGNVLLPALGEDAESLALVIGENATSATVNFSRGFGGELERLIERFLINDGVIDLREESLDSDLEDLDTDQDRLDRRIDAYYERLSAQFIAMEAIVRSLQQSSDFLETTLSSLLDSGKDN